MNTSRNNLFKKLKQMSEIYEKENKISHEILKEFCRIMLSSSSTSITFVAMYDGCSNFRSGRNSYKRKFYQLSRYIDQEIVNKMKDEFIFKRYDKAMDKFYASKGSMKNMISLRLTKQYRESDSIFNFDLLEEEEVIETPPMQSYQFDPQNLMI